MIALQLYYDGHWENARSAIIDDLQHIQEAINSNWNAVVSGSNTLLPGAIAGDATQATRYVANTGLNNAPKWDQVNLANGVTGRLPLNKLSQANPSTLVGRREGAGIGDLGEITLGPNLVMVDDELDALSSGDVSGPGVPVTDKAAVRWAGITGDAIEEAPPIFEDDGRISNVTDPVDPQDAATMNYVDTVTGAADFTRLRNPTLTTPGALADGDLWCEAAGVSPARTITLNLRDAGATIVLLTIVY